MMTTRKSIDAAVLTVGVALGVALGVLAAMPNAVVDTVTWHALVTESLAG